jgi:hypothetical protein
MKRWLLAVGLLLASTSLASADYLVIIHNLAQTQAQEQPAGAGQVGGQVGQVGGQVGQVGGQVGQVGRVGGQVGQVGGFNLGGRGGMAQAGGGFQLGGRGGMAQVGAGGQVGGRPPIAGGLPGAESDLDNSPLIVVAVIEVNSISRKQRQIFDLGGEVTFRHKLVKGGWVKLQKSMSLGATTVRLLTEGNKALPTAAKEFQLRQEALVKEKAASAGPWIDLASWALERGLLAGFKTAMEKAAELEKTNPTVVNYLKVKAELARPPAKEDLALQWKNRMLEGYKITPKGHYVVLHTFSTDSLVEVESQLNHLEDAFQAFYYWWALRNVVLKVPRERQVAVLPPAQRDDDVARLRKHLTAGPPVADGFFARRENLAILPASRSDQSYKALKRISDPLWKEQFDKEGILRGKGVPKKYMMPNLVNKYYKEQATVDAILLKAMNEEWEANGISHQASRQLLFASELLPTKVAVPEWIQFGLGSFFEAPLQSPWPSVGAPNSYWLPRFQDYRKEKKYAATPYETLVQVVTDGYFRKAAAMPRRQAKLSEDQAAYEAELRKGRAAAWSLVYFLARDDQTGPRALQNYFKELSRMPRDVALDKDVLLGCFARAFDCAGPGGRGPDPTKLTSLANRWDNTASELRLPADNLQRDIREAYEQMRKANNPTTTPPNPVGPGVGGRFGGRGGAGGGRGGGGP